MSAVHFLHVHTAGGPSEDESITRSTRRRLGVCSVGKVAALLKWVELSSGDRASHISACKSAELPVAVEVECVCHFVDTEKVHIPTSRSASFLRLPALPATKQWCRFAVYLLDDALTCAKPLQLARQPGGESIR